MAHATHSSFTVRSYEIDSYSHLNNGVYISWFEQARLDHLRSLGFSYDDFAEREEWFVVARAEVDFRRPLAEGDSVDVVSSIEQLGNSSVRWRQVMRTRTEAGSGGSGSAGTGGTATDDAPVACEAVTIMVFHGPDGRSISIPADFRAAVER